MGRKLLLSGAAVGALLAAAITVPVSAADLRPLPAPAPAYVAPAAPAFSWTGLYIGANAGAAWGDYAYDILFPAPTLAGRFPSGRNTSFIGGGQIGFNWQISRFVFGLEGDVDGKSLKVANSFSASAFPFDTVESRSRIEGSVRARGGLAFDRFLVYATGGWAVTDVKVSACLRPIFCATDEEALNGYTVGGGGEFAVTDNVSLGVEYRYSDFGRKSLNWTPVGGGTLTTNYTTTVDLREHQVTGRLNFRFGGLFQP